MKTETHQNRFKHMSVGPTVPFSQELHAEKYRGPNESFREAANRIASSLSDGPEHFHAFREMLFDMRFMPAGRIQAAIGSTRRVTPYNCFVSGKIEDTLVDGHGSILQRFKEAMITMRMGGGIGYDFSTLRPKGALIKKLQSKSSGPVSFMEIYDAGCRCIASAGHRRGAQMGILRVDHPDIEEFVHAKQNETRLTGFNISVAVTDEFMQAVQMDGDFDLRFGGEIYNTIRARSLWETIMRSTWDWAEPGVLFIDRINEMNNLRYCETIAATNPCAEQPLPPYGACLLGSFNLVKYVREHDQKWVFDYNQLKQDIPIAVRAMDNVVDRAVYPLYEQEQEAHSKRRMGLGVTGLANALESLGMPYGSEVFIKEMDVILSTIANHAYRASVQLAQEKGRFPAWDAQYLSSRFLQHLDLDVFSLIKAHGTRNSHLLSIAPTGTISLCADNVSSGIEPVFDYSFNRTVITEGNKPRTEVVDDYGVRVFGVNGKRSKDVTIDEHLAVLKTAYKWVDSAVSKTCNVPSSTPWSQFKELYIQAWESGCKGCTTFQVGGKRNGVLTEVVAQEPITACYIDSETGRHECS